MVRQIWVRTPKCVLFALLLAIGTVWTLPALADTEIRDRIWIRPVGAEPGPSGEVFVTVEPVHALGAPISFVCNVKCTESFDVSAVTLRVFDGQGGALFNGEIESVLHIGDNPCSFVWTPTTLADGQYRAMLVVHNPLVARIASAELEIRKINLDALREELRMAQEATNEMRGRIDAVAAEGHAIPYEQVSIAVAEDYLPIAHAKITQLEWPHAQDIVRFAQQTADSVRTQLAFMSTSPEVHRAVPPPPGSGLENRNGELWAGDRPVFLMGACVSPSGVEDLERLRRYGFRLASVEVKPAQLPAADSIETALDRYLGALITTAEAEDMALCVSLNALDAAGPAGNDAPRLDGDEARKTVAGYAAAATRYLSRSRNVVAVSLVSNPAFSFDSEAVRAGFEERVRAAYATPYDLNRAWRRNLRDFDDVGIWPDDKHLSYQFDWQTYHRELATDYLTSLMDEARAGAPRPWLAVAAGENLLKPAQTRYIPDFDVVANAADLKTVTLPLAAQDYGAFAMPFPGQGLAYALFRSFGGPKPILNIQATAECPAPRFKTSGEALMRSIVWEQAIEGMDGVAVMRGTGSVNGFPLWFDDPSCLKGLAFAHLDLNRLAEWVAAYQDAPADVAIVWSLPSRIHNDGEEYLESVRRAYEGCAFAGRKIRFMNEAEIAAGGLQDIQVLVMPRLSALANDALEAIAKYIDDGGAVVRTADRIPYTERGSGLDDTLPLSAKVYLVRGIDTPGQYRHAMEAVNVEVGLPPIPHAINEHGYPIEGVRSRYVEVNGEGGVYLLNMRPTPVTVYLTGGVDAGRDIIVGRDVQFPCELAPLDPMLVRLDRLPEKPEAGPSGPQEPPVAIVAPVPVADETAAPKPPAARARRGR